MDTKSQVCVAKTRKGKQCTRTASPESKFCWQHEENSAKTKTNKPWPLPVAAREALSTRARKRLETRLQKGPTKSDTSGFVYVFRWLDESPTALYKVGKTSRSLKERLQEWQRESPSSWTLILEKAIHVPHVSYAERVLHLFFDDVRVYRYQSGETFVDVWKNNGHLLTSPNKPSDEVLRGKKHIEWFHLPQQKDVETLFKLMRHLGSSVKKNQKPP